MSLNGHSLGMDYVIWSLGMWTILGQFECRLGIGCVTIQVLTGQGRWHMMGMIICHEGRAWGMSHEGH